MTKVRSSLDFIEIKKRRQRKRTALKISLYVLILALFGGSLVWLFVFSPLFQFQKLEVTATDENIKEKITVHLETQVKSSIFAKLLGNRNFLTWPSKVSEGTLAALPEVENLIIDKNYRENLLSIRAVERDAAGIWCFLRSSPPDCFKFDKGGFLFKESLSTSGNLIKVVQDFHQENFGIGDSILPGEFRENFLSVLKVLEALDLSTQAILLKDLKLEEIEVPTNHGPTLYFSIRRPADIYLEVLKSLSEGAEFQDYSYVDLRVLNRVYYK